MKKRIITAVIAMCMTVVSMTGCMREADRVTYNVQKEADNFNVERRLSVINARTDKPVLELIGYFRCQTMITTNWSSHWKPGRTHTR